MSITKREKTLIIALLLIAIIASYYYFFLSPYLADMKTFTADNDNKLNQINARAAQKINIDSLTKDIESKEKMITEYGDKVAQAFDQPTVLVYLSETVSKYAQKVAFYFDTPQPLGKMTYCTITATMLASYSGLKQVLSALSDGPYMICVTNITAAGSASDASASPAPSISPAPTTTAGTATGGTQPTQVTGSSPGLLKITLKMDIYSLNRDSSQSGYTSPSVQQYGGDIFS